MPDQLSEPNNSASAAEGPQAPPGAAGRLARPAAAVGNPLAPPGADMLVSIVVVAYNEAVTLPALLADICAQDYPHEKIELILVDSCSTDGTLAVMERFASAASGPSSSGRAASPKAPLNHAQAALSAKAPYRMSLQDDGRAASPRPPLEQGQHPASADAAPPAKAASSRPPLNRHTAALSAKAPYRPPQQQSFHAVKILENSGRYLPHGCNVALDAFSGDVFLRIDAHARIPADFIARNVARLAAGEAVCGGVRPVALMQPSPWGCALLAAEQSHFGSSPAAYRRQQSEPVYVASVFHAAYRREVFAKVGRFDERLRRTEDNDINQRVRAAGYRICLDPAISSVQYMRPTLPSMLRQKAANGYWIGVTRWLAPKCTGVMHFVPFAFVLCLLLGAVLGCVASWLPLMALLAVYLLAAVAVSVQATLAASRRSLAMLALPLVFLLMHLCYGTGTVCGLFAGAGKLLGGRRRQAAVR